ncbi:hypothetical protein BAMBUS_00830 [Brevundimonas phage vB_BpoS-Bambus]|nr:hypothetical protein BAMBUS_00830 [Brevundimonas phage vB_BpoS-Bambus]
MKRVFDDHGLWNPEAHAAGLRALPLVKQAFELLLGEGYNPREAQALITATVDEETLDRILVVKDRLRLKRAGHAEAERVGNLRRHVPFPPADHPVFTPEHKAKAFDLVRPEGESA